MIIEERLPLVLRAYEGFVAETSDQHGGEGADQVVYCAFGLEGETGEALDAFKKLLRLKASDSEVTWTETWAKAVLEVGDGFWYRVCLDIALSKAPTNQPGTVLAELRVTTHDLLLGTCLLPELEPTVSVDVVRAAARRYMRRLDTTFDIPLKPQAYVPCGSKLRELCGALNTNGLVVLVANALKLAARRGLHMTHPMLNELTTAAGADITDAAASVVYMAGYGARP